MLNLEPATLNLELLNAISSRMTSVWLWVGFTAFVLLMLGIDLGLFNRRAHIVSYGQALAWSGIWIALALLFSGVVYWRYSYGAGRAAGLNAVVTYLTGYIIELSLSV